MNFRRLFSAFFLLFVFVSCLAALPMFRFRSLVIHHSATEGGDAQSIRNAHSGRWFDMAYHLVLTNGKQGAPMGRLESGKRHLFLMHSAATRNLGCNLMDLHLCVVGNYEEKPVPNDMRIALVSAIKTIQERYNIPTDRVVLHRDCSATACPGKYVDKASLKQWLREIRPDQSRLDDHQAQLDEDYWGPIPRGPLLVVLPVLLLVLLFRAPLPDGMSALAGKSKQEDSP